MNYKMRKETYCCNHKNKKGFFIHKMLYFYNDKNKKLFFVLMLAFFRKKYKKFFSGKSFENGVKK